MKHIELVKKWLANPDSVSQEELEANYNSAQELWPGFYSTEQKKLMGITSEHFGVAIAAYSAMNNKRDWANYWINQIEAGL